MDAIRCKEWRLFPGLSKLEDKTGYIIFILVHVPIFLCLFWQLTNSSDFEAFRKGFNIFLVIHFGIHILFLKHKNNLFTNWISWLIIAGAGICGALDLMFFN